MLIGHWLRAFGPGTVADIKWWLGSTVKSVRRGLAEIGAVEVDLDGAVGYVLADDVDDSAAVAPWAALLPPLDPTTMGWIERDWYLGPYKPQLVDSTGNAGTHRVVGRTHRRRLAPTGQREVELQLLEDVGKKAHGHSDEKQNA